MRKILFILASLMFVYMSYGQTDISVTGLKNTTDAYIDVQGSSERSYVYKYGNEVSDTLNASDTWSYTVTLIKDFSSDLKYEARTELDSVSGSPGVSMILQGKYSWNDSWTPLDTAIWSGTSSDTTMGITYTTAKNYRFIRLYFVSDATAQKSQVERVEFGVYD